MRETNYTLDTLLQLKDDGAVTATGSAQVGGSDEILDLGSADVLCIGDVVIDVSAIDIASTDEVYNILLEGSDSSTFASGIEVLAACLLGDGTTLLGETTVDSDTGRYILPFRNERNGRKYRYVRLRHVISGTTPSINYTAFLCPGKGQ